MDNESLAKSLSINIGKDGSKNNPEAVKNNKKWKSSNGLTKSLSIGVKGTVDCSDMDDPSDEDVYNLEPEVEINEENNFAQAALVPNGAISSSNVSSQENVKQNGLGLREIVVVDTQGNKRIVCIGDGTNEPPVQPISKPKRPKPDKGTFPCPFCDYVSTWKKSIRRHVLVIHKNHKPFQCQQCDYSASERIILDRHVINIHKGDSAKPYKCHHCSYSAVEKGKWKRHMAAVHDGLRPHKCPSCPFSAVDKTRLKRHISSVHEGAKPYRCPHCVHSTSEKSNLKTHIMAVHLQVKPFSCPICSYSSSEKGTLNRHIRTVHRDIVQTQEQPITIN